MHIGGVAIIEGTLKFEDFYGFFEQRVHAVARLRQKLVSVPNEFRSSLLGRRS